MRELVRHERDRVRITVIVSRTNRDVVAHGDGIGAELVGEPARTLAAMNAHRIRVDADQRSEEATGGWGYRLSRDRTHGVRDVRGLGRFRSR